MTSARKQIHLAAHFPGVNNTTVWSDPAAGSHIDFSSFAHLARTAERARFDFLFLAEGLRLREQNGLIYDLDVVGRPDTFTVLAALAAVTDRLGLAGTINSTFNEPYEVARQFATLDHLSAGRAAWNVVTSWDEFTGENFRRGGFLAQDQRYVRAQEFLAATAALFDSWSGDEVVADQGSGVFLRDADAGRFAVHSSQFDISGRFAVPRSPQGRPVIFQAGDSEEGREFAAASADAIFTRHGTLEAGKAFYADVKGRLARHGRTPDSLKILPAATFVLGDTDADAQEKADVIRHQQVSGQTAIKFLEQLWNRDLSAHDPDGPLPQEDPFVGERPHRPRPGQRADAPRPDRDRQAVARAGRGEEPLDPRADHPGERAAVVHRHALGGGRGAGRVRAGRRERRVHPGPPHHPGRARRVRRHRRAAAAGAGGVPHRVRGHHAARAPGAAAAADPDARVGALAGAQTATGGAPGSSVGARRAARPRPTDAPRGGR
jgi:FMN-dependent oxidoreductase (nitrilotriacetate monooxygenase family)